MRRMVSIAGLLMVLLSISCLPVVAEEPVGKQLTSVEIKKIIINNTTHFFNINQVKFITFWNESGSMYGKKDGASSSNRVSGSWKVTDDNQLCASWNNAKWESGCRKLYRNEKTGDILGYNMEGTLRIRIMEIFPGNPENMN